MNDPCIVYEVEKVSAFYSGDYVGDDLKIRLFKKDKTHVDILTRECIVPYIEAAELYKSLNTSNNNINMVTLKDLLTEGKYRDILKMVCNV